MPKIFIAPANLACDQADLEHSIGNPVERQRIIDNFSDATYPELIDIERRGRGFHAWGIKLSPDHMEHWIQMGIGDFVLISYKGAYRHYGKVLGRYENEAAAQAVWNQPDDPKDLRELMFFVTEPVSLSVTLNDVADYLPEHSTEFQAIPEEAIDRITADFESVERFFRHRFLNTAVGGPILDMSGIIRVTEREQANLKAFDPESSKDGREKTVEMIIRRRGQPGFREALLDAYEHQCAITHCNATDALEAAYIIPYRGNYTHDVSNGILLRADLHTLFDLGKIAVDTRTMTLVLADELLNTSYRILVNRPLHYPRDETCRPSTEGLDLHRRLAGL
jgi:hypothetical protein